MGFEEMPLGSTDIKVNLHKAFSLSPSSWLRLTLVGCAPTAERRQTWMEPTLR